MSYWFIFFLILLIGGGGLIALLVYLHRHQKPPLLENLCLMLLALFVTLLGVEFYFKVFFAQTDSWYTLAGSNWHQRYNVKSYNSFGYRDKEWTDEMVADKIKVMVVGDSFVEGGGIEYAQDRFPDRLAQMLGGDYVVFNVGKGGASTQKEIRMITKYPYAPDILVLQYLLNDIDPVAKARGFLAPAKMPEVPPPLSPLVENSYAVNFFYWRLIRLLQANQPDSRWMWRVAAYNDPGAWWVHQQELLTIYEGARAEQIPFLVVVFPDMAHVEESRAVTQLVIDLYEGHNVPVLDVAKLIEGIPSDQLVASPVDPHPDELVHQLVAEALFEMFIEQELAAPTAYTQP